MPLGPVFRAELLTTSRRKRYYVARAVYGLALLGLVGWTYEESRRGLAASGRDPADFAFLARTATAIVSAFLTTQVVAVLCLTPAMVAGSIADERQRKTLHYLLASRLSSAEIVVGKLAARTLQLVVLVLSGLPILSLLSLFGGISPALLLAAFAGTLTTAFALASLSILVSAVSRRARDAIIATYVIEAALALTPVLVGGLVGPANAVPGPIGWGYRQALRVDPFQLIDLTAPTPGLSDRLAGMAGLQVAAGLGLLALAVWRLRPSFAGADRGVTTRGGGVGRLWGGLPPVGNDPMLWKERHVARLGPFLRGAGWLVGIFAAVFLGDALLDAARPALDELRRFGYGDAATGVEHKARNDLNEFLAGAGVVAYLVWAIGLAATAAAGVSAEREDDTWLSLLGTSLTGPEILRAKALGALWRWRWAGGLAVGLWTLGWLLGAIHPLAFALTLAEFAAFSAFALALGIYCSLRSKSTTRALVATVGVGLGLNLGVLLCLFPMAGGLDSFWLAPCTPVVIALSPARYDAVQVLFGTYPTSPSLRFDTVMSALLTCVLSLFGYAVAATGLAVLALNDFDRIADRPRRPPGYSRALAASEAEDA